jgi:M6 family metalloprotease-like protein
MSLSEAVLEDTIRILALKVEFQTETPDNGRTTGNGNFDLRTYEEFVSQEGHYIDPAPHGSAYFNSHLDALNRYWESVSDGQLSLTWDIYPLTEDEAFRLPVSMSYYGPQGHWPDPDNSHIGDRLGYFFIDAIHFADSSAPEINFADYQAIIVFHAGSDQQNNIDFIADTPDDFWTGFLRLVDPIEVDGGTFTVIDGAIMPETVNQDNRLNALNAVMAHEFGHQLGLVDLYKTKFFTTQIGDFSLMDNNGMSVGVIIDDGFPSVGGTIPVYPDAWSRAYLGFNVPREITLGQGEPVFASALQHSDNEIIKVPITEFEYFLIENRQIDADTLEPGFPYDNVLIGDPQTTVILGPGYAYFQGNDTILVTDAEYDRLIPGNGMLIWHVDESAAYGNERGPEFGPNNFWNNTLQWNCSRRFLSLVEADGIIDFGCDYYTGFGSPADMYRRFNNSELTPYSNPSSRSNLGADSHIFITGIPRTDTVMTADISIDWYTPGWPQMSIPGSASDPIVDDLDGDDSLEVIMASGNQLLIWNHDGSKYIPNADSIGILKFDSSIAIYPLSVAADCDTDIVGRPVVLQGSLDTPDGNPLDIAVGTASGNLYLFNGRDEFGSGRLDSFAGSPLEGVSAPGIAPIAVNFKPGSTEQLLTVDIEGGIHLIDWSISPPDDTIIYDLGSPAIDACAYSDNGKNVVFVLQQIVGGPPRLVKLEADSGGIAFVRTWFLPVEAEHIAAGDIKRTGDGAQVVAIGSNRISILHNDGSGFRNKQYIGLAGQPALGDIDSDGYPEIVVGGDSKIYAFNHNGTLLTDFPINLGLYDLNGMIDAPPILIDIDADGNPDIIVGLPGGAVYAFNYRGDMIAGFPLPSSFGIDDAAVAGDLNHDGQIDMLAVESTGFVKAWSLDAPYVAPNAPWPMAGGDAGNNGYLATELQKPIVISDQQLPENSVFCYPNPAKNSTTIRYYLNSESQVSIDIFDYIGERIHGVNLPGTAHADNEYVWDCSNTASGVYFCRVRASSAAGEIWRMVKIAVVN